MELDLDIIIHVCKIYKELYVDLCILVKFIHMYTDYVTTSFY